MCFLREGLAPSTRKTYLSDQRAFANFCQLSSRLQVNGSPYPATEWTICMFATMLAASLQPASIKVYLSAVRSIHIELGYPDPLKDCLRLPQVMRGIKRRSGSSQDRRLPITPVLLRLIYAKLGFTAHDDIMFWATCCLAFFGFLRVSEFTVPSAVAFSPSFHLTVADIAVDR